MLSLSFLLWIRLLASFQFLAVLNHEPIDIDAQVCLVHSFGLDAEAQDTSHTYTKREAIFILGWPSTYKEWNLDPIHLLL